MAGLGARNKYSAPLNELNDLSREERVRISRVSYVCPFSILRFQDFDPLADHRVPRIADREDDYRAKRRQMVLSPGARHDPFDTGKNTLFLLGFNL
jgi:splicing factor 3B subunit 1